MATKKTSARKSTVNLSAIADKLRAEIKEVTGLTAVDRKSTFQLPYTVFYSLTFKGDRIYVTRTEVEKNYYNNSRRKITGATLVEKWIITKLNYKERLRSVNSQIKEDARNIKYYN